MEIGTPTRVITIAPLYEPLGHPKPAEVPPVAVPDREPVLVPA